jgi:DNA mismatch repair protein MutS2
MNEHALDVLEFDKVIDRLVEQAASNLGKRLVRQLKPLTDKEQIETLIGETSELKVILAPAQELPLGGLHDIEPILNQLDAGEEILGIDEILEVNDTLRAARNVKAYLKRVEEGFPRMGAFGARIKEYAQVEDQINATFNEGGAIKNSASPKLRNIRNTIDTLRGRIRGKLHSIMRSSSVSSYLQDTSIRENGGRPVIAVKAQHASRVPGARRDRSDSGNTIFVEPAGIKGMVDEMDEARNAETEERARILRQLTAMIAEQAKPLRQTLEVLAHLDLTNAKVRFSRALSMHGPDLNDEGLIRLEQARHPLLVALQEESEDGEEVVPIDAELGGAFHTLIITGPNTGGKTVTLKTIGLCALMAQTGMHVPAAAGSSLPVFSQVWADIGDEQSIEQSLSTFSSHLRHIAEILQAADSGALVLLDELGGGTDPTEGAALARAILEHLHENGVRTAVTTHMSQLKNLGYTVAGIENASIEFNVETLRPTHRLLIGTPGMSNALAIARRYGVLKNVVKRAEQDSQADGTGDLVQALQNAKAQTVIQQRQVETALQSSKKLERELTERLAALEQREIQAKRQTGEAAFEILDRARHDIEQLCREESSRRHILATLQQIAATMMNELKNAPERPLINGQVKVGGRVRVRSLDRIGQVDRMDDSQDKVVVKFNGLPVTVPMADVEAL